MPSLPSWRLCPCSGPCCGCASPLALSCPVVQIGLWDLSKVPSSHPWILGLWSADLVKSESGSRPLQNVPAQSWCLCSCSRQGGHSGSVQLGPDSGRHLPSLTDCDCCGPAGSQPLPCGPWCMLALTPQEAASSQGPSVPQTASSPALGSLKGPWPGCCLVTGGPEVLLSTDPAGTGAAYEE